MFEFVWNALSGGVFYDRVKKILGKTCNKLKFLKDEDKKDEFQSHLEMLFEANENIKRQLEELKSGDIKSIENSFNNNQNSTINVNM